MFIIFMTLAFAMSICTTHYVSQNAIDKEKQAKLLNVAIYQDRLLGEQSYDDILREAGAANAPGDEQLAALNRALAGRTDEVAALFPGLGAGYYSIELDAILTYGPSEKYSDRVGVPIAPDHPGRTVMRENKDLVQEGTMVRGHIMNAMHPIVRGGEVIGYAWANELTSDIQLEYQNLTTGITVFLVALYAMFLIIAVMLSRRLIRDIDTIIAGVGNMRLDLTTRIENVGGELGGVANNINRMAEDIEKSVKEHEALLLSEAANVAQRDFLSHMSHEMRTPMNAVIGMTNIARKSNDPGKIQNYLEKIDNAANHLLGVINNVLDMSKIEAGKLELSETSFSFRKMLNRAAAVACFKIDEKRQTFMMEVDEDVPDYVTADCQRLTQVVTNLLSNANKFTPLNGSIQLRVNRLAGEGAACRLRIEVRDSGIGISREQQAKLFRSFAQADSSISRKYGGTGLGLVISRQIIEQMHGKIWIESELGHGASFIFEIEVKLCPAGEGEPESAAETGREEPEDNVFSGKRILLAEDVEINREIVLALLEPMRMEIDCAENGAEAVRIFSAAPEKYGMIFMDVQMPEMDGYEATRRIRSLEAGNAKAIPIIAMTANVFKEDIERCLAAGMNGHVGKPLDFDEVLGQLRNWLR
ncbi:MAG: response regulator [Oscillospiraceae bacterium]|nr:response regulator [Oscillospiraceae bacterium]